MANGKQLARKQFPRAQREAQILAAAFKEFAANGYAAARLDDVARRARIAKGTIFLHFRDKKALFRAVLCSLIRPLRPGSEDEQQSSQRTSESLLRELLAHMYSQVVENKKARSLIRLLIAESEKFPELAEIYYQEIIAPGASAIGLLVEKGIASGEFRPSDVHRFPQILVAPGVLAVMWMLLLGESRLDLEGYRAAHLDFVMRGLRAPAAENASQAASCVISGGPS